jgi:excinuclease ABC subunit A
LAAGWPEAWNPLKLVLGRFPAEPASESQLVRTVEEAWKLSSDGVFLLGEKGERCFRPDGSCMICGAKARPLSPALFSFNLPLGACPRCQGFGRVMGIDRARVIPDLNLNLRQRPIAPWNTPAYEEFYAPLERAAKERGLDLDLPLKEWSEADREWLWSGSGRFVNLNSFFTELESRAYKVHVRVLLSRYRAYTTCPECSGARLNPEARSVRWRGWTLPELAALSIDRLRRCLRSLEREASWLPGEEVLVGELQERLEILHQVGLDYLTLDRPARTLSGGEAQRIHLAAALGVRLTRTLYVLDEPTVGLHPRDGARLLRLLKTLADRGNTVLVVEHDPAFIRGADWLIDLGPGGGSRGGQLLAEGTPSKVSRAGVSPTGQVLRRGLHATAREHLARYRRERAREGASELGRSGWVEIEGANANNLKEINVRFPLGAFVAVVGVSGSGKSSLVEEVLFEAYRRRQGEAGSLAPTWKAIRGLESLAEVLLVDQEPPGRSTRSNPATYVGAFDDLRRIFSQTEAARRRRMGPSFFSFNRDEGRCPDCQGQGTVEVDMQFLAPVSVTCERCRGSRFRPEVLSVRHRGRNISEVLDLTIEEALEAYSDEPGFCKKLAPLVEVGLGYLRLGQPTVTLSGGEAQRLKLASFLLEPKHPGKRMFLFDEPTTGLHPLDIERLLASFRRFVERGDSLVVVEHHLGVIGRADWIVELGPGGGEYGGELLFSGPRWEFVDRANTPTAQELRRSLASGRSRERKPVKYRRRVLVEKEASGS